jgi:hypothetical protein
MVMPFLYFTFSYASFMSSEPAGIRRYHVTQSPIIEIGIDLAALRAALNQEVLTDTYFIKTAKMKRKWKSGTYKAAHSKLIHTSVNIRTKTMPFL